VEHQTGKSLNKWLMLGRLPVRCLVGEFACSASASPRPSLERLEWQRPGEGELELPGLCPKREFSSRVRHVPGTRCSLSAAPFLPFRTTVRLSPSIANDMHRAGGPK